VQWRRDGRRCRKFGHRRGILAEFVAQLDRISRVQRKPRSDALTDPEDRVHRAAAIDVHDRLVPPARELFRQHPTGDLLIDVQLIDMHLHAAHSSMSRRAVRTVRTAVLGTARTVMVRL
jgi:hypothetical protein